MSEEEKSGASQPQSPETQPRLQLDDTGAVTRYANFFLVTAGAEEMVMLFGIRSGDGSRAKIEERIVVTPANAKRILLAMSQTLKRYEDAFGTIDLTPKQPVNPPTAASGPQES